jgi:hypothetical protein
MFNTTKKICTQCGSVGKTSKITRGSFIFELILWLCFIVPGLLYSVYRATTKVEACKICKSRDVIPLDTPRGQKILKEFNGHDA